jgi:hypothetical protein
MRPHHQRQRLGQCHHHVVHRGRHEHRRVIGDPPRETRREALAEPRRAYLMIHLQGIRSRCLVDGNKDGGPSVHSGARGVLQCPKLDARDVAERDLIDRLVALGKERGWHRVYWHTREKNYRARTLYDRIVARTDYIRYDIDL